ncbi:hypothetical protein [Jiella pelagia]|uniref:Uncharacterized protein n=1 Tax=Jiella pelagia TaxID=2986949 RepID=A0ABY7C3Z9_9HYPH|nr:hypothetical protein [Jiella pelagia]WAP70644.1 hypothetical protein OH818_11850 [Jiella pelagia]
MQPSLADACGALGLGNKPTRTERLAWEALPDRSCPALRQFVDRFPESALRGQAADLLAARETSETTVWTKAARSLPLTVPFSAEDRRSEADARALALVGATSIADNLCSGFAQTQIYRVLASRPEPAEWTCRPFSTGYACGFSGKAICDVEIRGVTTTETCPPKAAGKTQSAAAQS